MYKLLLAIGLLFLAISVNAQDKHSLDSVDKIIINTIINSAEQTAGDREPAWATIELQVRASYTETETDRAITKAQIYYYYGKNWPKFSAAIVHYTEAYENKEDLALMNKNAQFILQHSENPQEWKTAQGWVKHPVDQDASNAGDKATYDALAVRINGH